MKTHLVICAGCGRMVYRKIGTEKKPCRRCRNEHVKKMNERNPRTT